MHFEKDSSFVGRWPLFIIDGSTPGDLTTIDAHSSYMLAARLESEGDAKTHEARALALLTSSAERKHPLAMKRMFDVLSGDDVFHGPDKRNRDALVRLVERWNELKFTEKLGA